MTVCIELPEQIETALREQLSNLDEAVKEACLVEFYRQAQISHCQLAMALGLDRYATDGVLKRHGVWYGQPLDDVRRQVDFLATGR